MYDDRYDDPNLTGVARSEAGLPPPRLWRSRANRVVAGVLGGLAEKFGLEARPLRLLYSLLTVLSGGLLVIPYVGIWAITRPHGPSRVAPRLWRSSTDKVIAGVMGGLAERFDVSSTLLRVLFVMVSVFSAGFPGILVYLILWMFMGSRDDFREADRY
jgi:phage shock protein C